MSETDFLKQHGRPLIANGYSIIPIPNGSKSPVLKDWQNTRATNETLSEWLENDHKKSGVGVLTKYNPAIDIDVSDQAVNERIAEYVSLMIGNCPVRVGNQPKRIMLTQTNTPFSKMKTGKYLDELGNNHEVEILADGQQFVAYAIHKDTGLPYKWVTDRNPTNTASGALPEITQDQAKGILQYAKQQFEAAGWVLKSNDTSTNTLTTRSSISDDQFAEDETKVKLSISELRNRLMTITGAEDHDLWVKIGMALFHQYDGKNTGLKLWHEWSATADNYDAEALDKRYKSFSITGKNRAPITARLILSLAKDAMNKSDESTVQLVSADQIPVEILNWLWKYWLAEGKLILLAGSPGTGKTTLAMSFASIVSKGGKWPDGTFCSGNGNVVVWSGEDGISETLIPRIIAHGGNLKNISFVSDVKDAEGNSRPFDPANDSKKLLEAIKILGNVKLIIIDPIVSAIAGDSHKNAEVRRGLQPLVNLAMDIGAVLIGITHFTKGTSGKDTTERVTGSLAFAALARLVLATARDTEGGGYILTRSKSNIGPDGGGFRYTLEQVELTTNKGVEASCVVWGDALEGNARDLIGEAEGDQVKRNDGKFAVKWLSDFLSDGPKLATEVIENGALAGLTVGKLRTAKKNNAVISSRDDYGKDGRYWWLMPGQIIPKNHVESDGFSDDDL